MLFQPFGPRRDLENPGLGIPGGLPRLESTYNFLFRGFYSSNSVLGSLAHCLLNCHSSSPPTLNGLVDNKAEHFWVSVGKYLPSVFGVKID